MIERHPDLGRNGASMSAEKIGAENLGQNLSEKGSIGSLRFLFKQTLANLFWPRTPGILFLILVTVTCAMIARAEVLPVKTYTSSDGLIYESVTNIYQDSRGFMWFCTPVGLSRFDGYRFTNYGMQDGLTNTMISDIVEDNNGAYWISAYAGNVFGAPIYRFDPRHKNKNEANGFTSFKIADQLAANDINSLIKTRTGQIFVGTSGGLFVLDDSQAKPGFSPVPLNEPARGNPRVFSIAEDAEGSLWIGHTFGLSRRLPDGRIIHYEIRPGSKSELVSSVAVDKHNRIWLVTNKNRLGVFDPEPLSSINNASQTRQQLPLKSDGNFATGLPRGFAYLFKPEENSADGDTLTVYCSSDDKVWLGTAESGLGEFDGRGFRFYTKENGLSDNCIYRIKEDTFGNLWLGSSWGTMKLTRHGFVTYKLADGLAAEYVFSFFEDQAGVLYAISSNSKINRFDGRRFTSITPNLPKGIVNLNYSRFLRDHEGDWWIGTSKGVYRFSRPEPIEQLARARPVAVYTRQNGLPAEYLEGLFEDSRGDVWFGFHGSTGRGFLSRWERATSTFHNYSPQDGIPADCNVEKFSEDSAGNVFVACFKNHLLVYRNGRFLIHSLEDIKKGGVIYGIWVDQSGRLWVATPFRGLLRIDNPASESPQVKVYMTGQGLSSNHIQYILEDLWGRIYFVTSHGADRLDVATGKIKYYTLADGLAAAGTGSGYRDHSGTLWFGTSRGLSKFVPSPDQTPQSPPIFIGGLRIGGKNTSVSALGETEISGLTLEPDQRQVQIDFYGLSLATGEALRYQYKLDGSGEDWSAPTEGRTANYPSLPSGSFRFLVRAVNSDGIVSDTPAVITFKVLRPIWQRWWFVTLALCALGGVAYAVYRYRMAQLLKVERVRTRIATDLHDDIGASLSRMAILSEVVKQQTGGQDTQASGLLTEIADSARGLVDSMSDIVWSIDPRRDDLQSVVRRIRQFASDVLEAKGIEWELRVPPEVESLKLDPEERQHLFLIFKEGINNVARHGQETTSVSLSIKVEGRQLIGEINDNGCGFTPKQPDEARAKGRGGNGLPNMRARAEQLGGRLEIASSPGAGTRLTLKVPVG
jgi:ligand-binding sensor domain-containing protein/two-component sensor histidine kinase